MYCCPNCFDDTQLRKEIIPFLSKVTGKCDYCGSDAVNLVKPNHLSDYFSLLIGIYNQADDGKLLVEWLKEDWLLFTHPNIDIHLAKTLLSDILDDGEIVRKLFSPSPEYISAALDRWAELRTELMYTNRYFPNVQLDTERLEQLLSFLSTDEISSTWYRARIQNGEKPFTADEMGIPPNRLASHGRANPPGIPYLYLGSSPETAASEIRPHTGEIASVAKFQLEEKLKAVDLRNPRKLVSPFILGDESQIGLLRIDIPFLEQLGLELTRPVQQQGAPIDYVPSQYLCEFIKKCGYNGVIYNSSVSNGINLALFDSKNATATKVSQYEITRVFVDVQEAP